MNLNRVLIAGNLTRDPELRYTPGGMAVCDFTVAINSFRKGKDGEKIQEATFVAVTAWDKTAENVAEYCKKGANILVEGRLTQNEWTDDQGNKKSKTKITANMVQFASRPKEQPAEVSEEPQATKEEIEAAIGQDEVPF